ncbi:MAG: ImmA/IrrE family metallo-endopeptidase [Planctomycetia bacterium]|nr:ImmA/IrrE family metallo-endopeptidase [Planctomycetia bacterium]
MSLIFNDFEYEYVSDREMEEGLEGLTVPKDNKIVIPESIMILAVHGDGRARFTFAHEIGHYFLHRHEKQGFARQRCCNIPTYRSSEWQANTFAGEFLMPFHLIYGLNPDEIREKCIVSRTAAEYQWRKCHEKKKQII